MTKNKVEIRENRENVEVNIGEEGTRGRKKKNNKQDKKEIKKRGFKKWKNNMEKKIVPNIVQRERSTEER